MVNLLKSGWQKRKKKMNNWIKKITLTGCILLGTLGTTESALGQQYPQQYMTPQQLMILQQEQQRILYQRIVTIKLEEQRRYEWVRLHNLGMIQAPQIPINCHPPVGPQLLGPVMSVPKASLGGYPMPRPNMQRLNTRTRGQVQR